MGYEIVLFYKSEIEKGVYEEEVQTKKIKIGTLEDDLGLEAVAGRIFAQFARRNILVIDVEVWEFTKKKLSFREAEDGFVIKNRKFKFDGGAAIIAEETPSEAEQAPIQPQPQPQPQQSRNQRILRYEVYDPAPELIPLAQQNGLKFTPKNRYPIFGEKTGQGRYDGMIYSTRNDLGHDCNISDRYFVGPQVRLEGEGQFIEDSMRIVGGDGPEPTLSFAGDRENMPSLRR